MYEYKKERSYVFGEDGQERLLRLLDRARLLIRSSGACTRSALLQHESGGNYEMYACVDRLVELGYLRAGSDGREEVYFAGHKLKEN